jgi:periplasmic protein TonB
MNYLKTKKEKNQITSAIVFSLLIHSTAGVILVFCLSNNFIFSPPSNKLNLVWVSLDNKSSNGRVSDRATLRPLDVKETTAKPANAEKPEFRPEPAQVIATKSATTAEKDLANNINLAKFDISGSVSKESGYNATALAKYDTSATKAGDKAYNISVGSTNQTAADKSNLNTVNPSYREKKLPAYPAAAKSNGYEGIVVVYAEILPNGHVGKAKIRKSSGYAILDQAAIAGVKKSEFEPARKSGNPFTAWVELPIKFILNNSQS